MRIYAGTLASLLEADLLRAGWNGINTSYPGQTAKQKAAAVISQTLLKKYLVDPSRGSPEADAKALTLFLNVNEACKQFKLDATQRPSWERVALGEAQAFLYRFFFPSRDIPTEKWGDHEAFILTQNAIFAGFGVGPGANIGSPETDFYSKFSLSTMSASNPVLFKLYEQAIAHNPTWVSMEILRRTHLGCAVAESSRLSFVPKTAEISRTICTEPVLNMIFQKGIANVLQNRLFQVLKIDLKDQQFRNRRLAQIGSITGEFGTIDLSSASDSMSLELIRKMFPTPVVRWLEMTSCRSTILPDGSKQELHMISSMGNAFTFPLQTIFFSALVYGCYKACGLPIIRPGSKRGDGNFAVFGDDIIVKKEAYDLVCTLLSLCGFSVNVNKSFNTGLFRESCGADFFDGTNVRGVYISHIRDGRDCYSAINRLNRWSAAHSIPLPSTVSYLMEKCRFLPIPFDEDDSAGVKVHSTQLIRKRRYHRDTGGILYRYATDSKRSYSVDPPFNNKQLPKGFYLNPDGLLVCLLAGGIRDGRIGLRSLRRKTVVKRRYSSRWDYIPADQRVTSDFDRRWKSFVEINLSLD